MLAGAVGEEESCQFRFIMRKLPEDVQIALPIPQGLAAGQAVTILSHGRSHGPRLLNLSKMDLMPPAHPTSLPSPFPTSPFAHPHPTCFT